MPDQTGPKLSDVARSKVCVALVNGKTNNEINGMLVDMGFSSLSDNTITTYRTSKEVRALIDVAIAEIQEIGLIPFRARLKMLNDVMYDILTQLAGYGVDEEVEIDADGVSHTKKVDSRRTKDYNQKLVILLNYEREMSRLVDKFETSKGAGGLDETAAPVPQNITAGQVVDAMEYLIRSRYPDRVKAAEAQGILKPAAPHIARLLEANANTVDVESSPVEYKKE